MSTIDRHDRREPMTDLDARPTMRQRTGVQHALRDLLDALAPERSPARGAEPPPAAVRRVRSPRGCILQGDACAVTVSWFPPGADEPDLGALHVISWRGVVSRPGAARRASGASAQALSEDVLCPVESATDGWSWRAGDGTVLGSGAVAERCLRMLERRARGD
jgi:hypothetical protein